MCIRDRNTGLALNFTDQFIENFDKVTIKKLTAEVNRQSLMIGYINSFMLFAIVSFLTIPFLFLIKEKK